MLLKNNLIGIIACGGNSDRMGTDKSLLVYYNKPQRYYLCDLLRELCNSVYISCNKEQVKQMFSGYQYIIDEPAFNNAGPLTACLSAFKQFPGRDILLIACDYPYLTGDEITRFIDFFAGKNKPAAFYNLLEKVFVPVLGYYPAGSEAAMLNWKEDSRYSLKQLLKDADGLKYVPKDLRSLISFDTPAQFKSFNILKH